MCKKSILGSGRSTPPEEQELVVRLGAQWAMRAQETYIAGLGGRAIVLRLAQLYRDRTGQENDTGC